VNYDDALRFLDRHVNLEAKAGRWEGLSLERISALMAFLGDPHLAYPVIHVTGTNGKGSTSAMITELLRARGLVVGTYTSPHLERLNERIRVDATPIDDDAFASAIFTVASLADMIDGDLSYFEVLTAAAFVHFADVAVDVAVIEVGLLGRWDATNVVDAAVAVVTNIGRDHTDGVGDWRRAIAYEKAGIIKPDSIVMLGETDPHLRDIFAAEPSKAMFERGNHFEARHSRVAVGGRACDLSGIYASFDDVFVPLHGAHQGDNAAIALAAVEGFFGSALEDDLVREAFAKVSVPGRLEIMGRRPLVVLDAAHNPDGARAATATLIEDFGVGRKRILVLGLLQGRDIGEMLDALDAQGAGALLVCEPDWPRRIPAGEIVAVAHSRGIAAETFTSIDAAIANALGRADPDDIVLVTGSNYVIGAARPILARRS
jgi:dihydrofolate synthase / folylpolyglutamate synthase